MNMELVYKQLDELLQMGRIEETEDFLIAAMGRAQQEGDYNSLIALLNEMTGYQKETGKPDKAVAYGAQAIELMKQLGMSGQWNVWKRHLRLFRESRNIRNRPW